MKSTLLNMTAVLFAVTLVASAGVGAVHLITEEPIARARAAAEVEALERVLPPFEHTVSQELVIGDLPVTVYTATDGEGRIAGYAVKSETRRGFGGVIRMMTGFGPDGRVLNVNVLEQTETPGLGTAMAEEDNVLLRCVQGRRPAEMQLVDGAVAVRKDGGDVDALTAATISSRAWCDALNRAWRAYEVVANGADAATFAGGTDASSGATSTARPKRMRLRAPRRRPMHPMLRREPHPRRAPAVRPGRMLPRAPRRRPLHPTLRREPHPRRAPAVRPGQMLLRAPRRRPIRRSMGGRPGASGRDRRSAGHRARRGRGARPARRTQRIIPQQTRQPVKGRLFRKEQDDG